MLWGIFNDYDTFGFERVVNPFLLLTVQIPWWFMEDYIFPMIWTMILEPIWNLTVWWFTIPEETKITLYTNIILITVVVVVLISIIAFILIVLNVIYATVFEDTLVALLLGLSEEWIEQGAAFWEVFMEFVDETKEKYPKEDMPDALKFWKFHQQQNEIRDS